MAPAVFIFETLKFKINVNDHNPPHVHVEGGGTSIRVNLITFEFMDSETDFSVNTLKRIMAEVKLRKELLLEEWKKYHEEN